MKRSAAIALALAVLVALVWLALRDVRHEPPAIAPAASEVPARNDSALAKPDVALTDAPPESQRDSVEVAASSASTAPALNQIRVRVVDSDRKPIAGARVESFDDSRAAVRETDADGRAMLPIAPEGTETMRLAVSAEGHFHVRAFYERRPELEIVLPDTVRLSGRVLHRDTRAPMAGVRIEHVHGYCKGCQPERTLSDAGGRYAVEGVPVGRNATFELGVEGMPGQSATLHLEKSGPSVEHDFLLDPGVEFSGVVVDFTTGSPVADATIENEGRTLARTDAQGRFTTRAAAVASTGRIDLRFGAPGYCWLRRDWNVEELTAENPLKVTLPRGVVVTGLVRDAAGAPVEGLGVIVRADVGQFFTAVRQREMGSLSELASQWRLGEESYGNSFRTDSTGRYRSHGLVAHTPLVQVSTMPSDRGRFEREIGPLGAPGVTVTLDFALVREEYGTIAGRMLLNGAPSKGYVAWRGATRNGDAQARDDGSFVLEHVEPGQVAVTTRRGEDRNSRLVHEDTLSVVAGQRVERDFDLTLAMKPVAGRVVRTDGGSAADLFVVLFEWPRTSPGGHRQRTKTSADGRFQLELPDGAGTYRAVVYLEDLPFEHDGIRAGDRDVEIVIGPVPIVLCRAIDAQTREPLRALDVFARGVGDERYEKASQPIERPGVDGWMRLRIPAGSYDVLAHGGSQGYAPAAREDVLVASSGETRIELEMNRGVSLELRLANGVKPWDPSHRVMLFDEDVALAIEKLGVPSARFAEVNPRHPGVEPGLDCDVDLVTREVAVVRGLAPGRYRLCDATLALTFTPDVIEVRAQGQNSVAVGWRAR